MTAIKREEIIGDCRLLLGDNMPIMADMSDNEFQLAIVDPPYFEGPNKPGFYRNGEFSSTLVPAGKYGELKYWAVPGVEYFKELKRVGADQIIWGANHFCNKFDSSSSSWVVWDKMNGSSSFADAELAYTSFKNAVRVCRYRWNGMIQGSHGNKKLNEKRIHPTQKPVSLYRWLLKNYAKPGDHILDTHGGSMSIVIACLEMGYKITAIEIDEDYFNAGVERVRKYQRQGKLFAPPKQQPKPQGLFK